MNHPRKGQTLITLLIFIIVMMTIAATSTSIIISNAQNTSSTSQSMEAFYAAEAGVENALLQLLRNPEYTGETIQIQTDSTVQIQVSHTSGYTVVSKGISGSFTRIIQANVNYTDNVLSVISWKEIYQ